MSLKIDRLQLEIIINNDQARKSLRALEEEAKQLKKDLKEAPEGSDEWNKINNRLKAIQVQHDGIIEKLGLEKLSIKELGQRQRELNAILRQMDPSMQGYTELKQQLEAIKLRQAELNGKTRQTNTSLSKMAQGFNKYFTMVTAGIAAFTGVFFSIKELISGLSDLDDQMANVMKTTGLTKKEVRELHGEFKYLNTRTSRKELMLLAEEAGRLGKKSKKDVMDFVEVANQIKIALGDDLGGNAEEAIREVGKLTTIYKIGEKYGTDFKESMLKVGSAINEVSANSQAQAPYLIETLKRMGGLAEQAGIMADDVIGYGSALDQLGQRTEMSTTALNKVILNMFTDTSTYADIAKTDLEEFTKLLNTDANEAFLKVLEGLNGNNDGLAVMGEKLQDLGLDGSRAVQVLASLASNTQMIRKEQDLANKALKEGTSLTNEYNVKNNNMAGNMEKIGRAMHAWFINSTVNKGLETFVGYFSELVNIPISDKLEKERLSVNGLVVEMTSANTTAERRNTIYNQLKEISPDIVAGIDLENLSIIQLRKNLALFNEEQIKKIALQKSDEKLSKSREEYGKLMGSRIETEQSAYSKLYKIKEEIGKLDANAANEIEKIILSNIDLADKAEAVKDIAYETSKWYTYTSDSYSGLKYDMAEMNRLKELETEAQTEFNSAFSEYQTMYNAVMDKTKAEGSYPSPPPPPDWNNYSTDIPTPTLEDYVKAHAKEFEAWKESRSKFMEEQDLFEYQKITSEASIKSQIEAEKAKELRVQEEMAKWNAAINQEFNLDEEVEIEDDPEIVRQMVINQMELDLWAQTQEGKLAIAEQTMSKEEMMQRAHQYSMQKMDQETNKAKLQNAMQYAQMAGMIANGLSMMYQSQMNKELKAAGDNEEQKEAIQQKYAKKQQNVAVMQAIMNGALSVMSMWANAPNPIIGAIYTAIVAGVTAAEVGVIKSQQFAEGNRMQVIGAQDGKKYNAKVVNKNHASGLFNEPTYAPGFGLFGETQDPELVFNPQDTKTLLNSPALIDAINMTLGSTPQFAQGNATEIIRENNTVTTTTMDDETKALLADIRAKLAEPSTAYLVADEDYIRTHQKKVGEYDTFKSKVSG